MSETKNILTNTIVSIIDSVISVYTYFQASIENIINFFTVDSTSFIDDTLFSEGEFGYTTNSDTFSSALNGSGELIVVDSEVSDYFIDEGGSLIKGVDLDSTILQELTEITSNGFVLNWSEVTGVTKYYLDISIDSQFNKYVSGYVNRDVGLVLSFLVEDLESSTTYYCRIRSYDNVQIGLSSNIVTAETLAPPIVIPEITIGTQTWMLRNIDNNIAPITYSDWFLPSEDELNEMYVNLYLFGLGGFLPSVYYQNSTEVNSLTKRTQLFSSGVKYDDAKGNLSPIRACRSFVAPINTYNLRDRGPAGGWIFYISGTTYYEAAPRDQNASQVWSNITNVAIGTTGVAIGTGQQNTLDIINQVGFTDGAAKTCNDFTYDVGSRVYNNSESNAAIYGRLYSWYTIPAIEALYPGWHVPTDTEWTTLTDYLGGLAVAGGKLKESSLLYWNSPNTDADNSTLFTALPGGLYAGGYSSLNATGYLWSSSKHTVPGFIWARYLSYNSASVVRAPTSPENFCSIRLIKNSV